MNSPENPHEQMNEKVFETESVKDSLHILEDQLRKVAKLQAIQSYIIKRADIELLGNDPKIDPFEIQQDILEGKTKLDSAVAEALDAMNIVFLEQISERLDNLPDDN